MATQPESHYSSHEQLRRMIVDMHKNVQDPSNAASENANDPQNKFTSKPLKFSAAPLSHRPALNTSLRTGAPKSASEAGFARVGSDELAAGPPGLAAATRASRESTRARICKGSRDGTQ